MSKKVREEHWAATKLKLDSAGASIAECAAKRGVTVEEYVRQQGERTDSLQCNFYKTTNNVDKCSKEFSPVRTLADARANPEEPWAKELLALVGEVQNAEQ